MPTPSFQLVAKDMHCASCAGGVRQALLAHEDVVEVGVNVPQGLVSVSGTIDPVDAADIVTAAGYPAEPAASRPRPRKGEREAAAIAKERLWWRNAVVGLGIWVPSAVLHWTVGDSQPWLAWTMLVTATAVLVIVGPGFFSSAWAAAKRRTTNRDTLISIGAGAAWAWSVVLFVLLKAGVEHGLPLYFTEASAVLGLISLGHWFEARSSRQAGSAIRELLELQPDTAERIDGSGATTHVSIAAVAPGDRLLVRPGGRLPVDGVVIEGTSEIDES